MRIAYTVQNQNRKTHGDHLTNTRNTVKNSLSTLLYARSSVKMLGSLTLAAVDHQPDELLIHDFHDDRHLDKHCQSRILDSPYYLHTRTAALTPNNTPTKDYLACSTNKPGHCSVHAAGSILYIPTRARVGERGTCVPAPYSRSRPRAPRIESAVHERRGESGARGGGGPPGGHVTRMAGFAEPRAFYRARESSSEAGTFFL